MQNDNYAIYDDSQQSVLKKVTRKKIKNVDPTPSQYKYVHTLCTIYNVCAREGFYNNILIHL
jgi:hypothetical protein